jgi:uncharacterized protein YndB with AHSA1/START domain
MPKLFVQKSIEINASASKIWEVLTNSEMAKKWIKEFWTDFGSLESDWKLGSPVLWKVSNGKIGAEGNVSIAEPYTMLQFSFKVNDTPVFKQEDLNYKIEDLDGRSVLVVSMGDFGDTPEHEMCYSGAVESWDKALPKIKELAELEL